MQDFQAKRKRPLQTMQRFFLETKKGIATANPSYVSEGVVLPFDGYIISLISDNANFCRDFCGQEKLLAKNRWQNIVKNYFSTQKNTGKVLAGITISGR